MDQRLGDEKLRRVNSPDELILGKKYLYFEAEPEQVYNSRVNGVENMEFITTRILCRKTLIYESVDVIHSRNFRNFRIIKDSPPTCSRGGLSSVGQTLTLFDSLIFEPNNNEFRLYHTKSNIPETAIGAGKRNRTKRLKSKRRRTRKNKRKLSLRKKN